MKLAVKVVGIFLGVMFLLSCNVFAMTFSQPIKINGQIGPDFLNGGFCVENATHNNGSISKAKNKKITKRQYFDKGVAQFESGQDALFAHYNVYKDEGHVYFGSKNIQNTFPLAVTVNWQGEKIYKINSDNNITLYMIFTGFDVPGNVSYYFLGRRADGIWVKYIDTDIIKKDYFGKSNVMWLEPKIKDDTIVLRYNIIKSFWNLDPVVKAGEFRFKWDNAAQWFGIEQVVY